MTTATVAANAGFLDFAGSGSDGGGDLFDGCAEPGVGGVCVDAGVPDHQIAKAGHLGWGSENPEGGIV